MAQSKEELDALLKFIKELTDKPENKWFEEKLKEEDTIKRTPFIPNNNSETIRADIEKLKLKVEKIEKYLGLDFRIDNMESIIDYSNIEDEVTRNQLISDNREMLRYRWGTRSHKEDFYEFCKYAHFQAEMLLNYLYEPLGSATIEDCTNHIRQFNKIAKFDEKTKTVSDISYSYKLWAFCNEFFHVEGFSSSGTQKQGNLYRILDHVKETRNSVNHRGIKDANVSDNNKYHDEWLKETSYDEVIKSLRILAEKVQSINRQTFLISSST